MFWASQLKGDEAVIMYQKLSLGDILMIRTLLNFNRLVVIAILFLGLSLIDLPILRATGWVGYSITTLQILYVHLWFKKWVFAGFIFLSFVLNLTYFWLLLS